MNNGYNRNWAVDDLTIKELYIIKDILEECVNSGEMLFEWETCINNEIKERNNA